MCNLSQHKEFQMAIFLACWQSILVLKGSAPLTDIMQKQTRDLDKYFS